MKIPHRPWFLKRWFIQGLVLTLPLALTITFFHWIVTKTDAGLAFLFGVSTFSNPVSFPGMGLVFVTVFLILVGLLAENVLIQQAIKLFNYLMAKAPITKNIYPTLFKVVETLLTGFDQNCKVVRIQYPRPGIYTLAFMTGSAIKDLQLPDQELVNVFLPTSPIPTSGFYLLLPRQDVVEVPISYQEAIKLIVSAGITG